MSGSAPVPPKQIVPGTGPRQTLPYGDRPFVDPRSGVLTQDAHQWIQRLAASFGTTVQNVGTLVTATNTLSENITQVNEEIVTINDEIQNNTTQILNIQGDPGFPPTPMAPQPTNPPPPSAVQPPLYPPMAPSVVVPPLSPDPPPQVPLAVGLGLGFFFAAMPP
jgi:hypothetical protein